MKKIIGIDIGGTTVKFGYFEGETLRKRWSIPTRVDETGSQIIPDIADSIRDFLTENGGSASEITGIGLDFPGHVFPEDNCVEAVNIHWDRYPLFDAIKEHIGIEAVATNDANAAALAEGWMGAAKGIDDFVMVTLGTGVGGGIVAGGKLLEGKDGCAGEIGHITVNPNESVSCNCGNCGCLEQYAAAPGFVRWAREAILTSGLDSPLKNMAKDNEENVGNHERVFTPKVIFDEAADGDELALQIAGQYAEYLGIGLGSIGSVINPSMFVIGGGIAGAGEMLLQAVERHYRKHAYPGARNAVFVPAKLGNDAGIYGAARLAATAKEGA